MAEPLDPQTAAIYDAAIDLQAKEDRRDRACETVALYAKWLYRGIWALMIALMIWQRWGLF